MVYDEEILSVVENASSLGAACRELVARANEKGGEDNITVILIRK
jgi:serine/threonine protein phosphatase PrpC